MFRRSIHLTLLLMATPGQAAGQPPVINAVAAPAAQESSAPGPHTRSGADEAASTSDARPSGVAALLAICLLLLVRHRTGVGIGERSIIAKQRRQSLAEPAEAAHRSREEI